MVGLLEVHETTHHTGDFRQPLISLSNTKIDNVLLNSIKASFRKQLVITNLYYQIAKSKAVRDTLLTLSHSIWCLPLEQSHLL